MDFARRRNQTVMRRIRRVAALLAALSPAAVLWLHADDRGSIMLPAAVSFARLCGIGTRNVPDADFIAHVNGAMSTMMRAMSIAPSGRVDDDFVATMVPHHEGAIRMAESELVFGTNPNLRRIAQEIIVDQQQEITAMRFALGQSSTSTASSR